MIYKSTLDAKGRINIPTKLREELGDSFHITMTIDKNPILTVYSDQNWNELTEKIKAMPQIKSRDLSRIIIGSECPVKSDPQGRVLIPPSLRDYARLEGEIVLIGLEGKTEIWSKAVWDNYREATDMNNLIEIAVELGL
ncbi:MAG: division/cell wall cluster transcriptional repressor MraZ [Oscillospiraceae bacterium]|jgi:MraZ protein|nr:division/cell wall cluster transcriptional repressor MraZ [Oscillospiraceae bacterium]